MEVLVTAGPTREHLDPVRFLTNASTGRMGIAVARAASTRGHRVTLIHGPIEPALLADLPPAVARVPIVSAAELARALEEAFPRAELLFMVAAVADFRPVNPSPTKLKRTAGHIAFRFAPTEDILQGLGRRKEHRFLVGFTLETGADLEEGRRKLVAKNVDLLVLNRPENLGDTPARVTLLWRSGETEAWPPLPKPELARRLVARVEEAMGRG